MLKSKASLASAVKGDTILLNGKIYDVVSNNVTEKKMFLIKHSYVQSIDSAPESVLNSLSIEYPYDNEKEKIFFLNKFSKVNTIAEEPKYTILDHVHMSGYSKFDDVILHKTFLSNCDTSLILGTDEYRESFQGKTVTIANIRYSSKLRRYIFNFEQDKKNLDWFGDVIDFIDDLPF